jgi:hydroxymethylbilane synthase
MLTLRGFVGAPDGREAYRDTISGPAADAVELGRTLASRMQAAGAGPLLDRLRSEAGTQS